jgi:hypothetical protein
MCWGAACNITAAFACHGRSLLSRFGSAARCVLVPFSERGEIVATAAMPARCARHLAVGNGQQPCSEVRVVCGMCASHPAAAAAQVVSTGPTPSTLDVVVTPEAESRADPQALAAAAGQATAVKDWRAEGPKPRAGEIDVDMTIKVTRAATKAAAKAVQGLQGSSAAK